MAEDRERSDHRPQGIFDVRDRYRERQVDDGLAARVLGPVRFGVVAVVTPAGRVKPTDWRLDTRQTLSGLSVFRDRVAQGHRSPVLRTLPPSTTGVEVRVSSPGFQARDLTFQPDTGQRVQVDLEPAVDYPFGTLTARPDESGPSLLRGSVRDEADVGVADAAVAVQQGLYDYRTDADGAWVIVLPDELPWPPAAAVAPGRLQVDVTVTLTPGPWQTATLLPDPAGGPAWTGNGLVKTITVTALRGSTVPVPELRLRLT